MSDEEIARAKVVSVGFPDFWPVAQGKFGRQFAAIGKAIEIQNRLCAIPIMNNPILPVVVRWMLQVAANTTGAMLVLAVNGFGPDAMRLARGTFEFDVNALYLLYLVRHPEEIDDFIDFRHITWKKTLDHVDKNNPVEARRFSPKQRSEIESEYARVIGRCTYNNGRIRRSWAKIKALISAHRALASLGGTYNKVVPLGQDALIDEMDADFEHVWARKATAK